MEELDIENALELYESLPINSRAADLYFDKVILQEGENGDKAKAGFKKVLEFFVKKNDATTTVNSMLASLDGMSQCVDMSPYGTPEQKSNDKAVLAEYKNKIANISKIINDAEEARKKANQGNNNTDKEPNPVNEDETAKQDNTEGQTEPPEEKPEENKQ